MGVTSVWWKITEQGLGRCRCFACKLERDDILEISHKLNGLIASSVIYYTAHCVNVSIKLTTLAIF